MRRNRQILAFWVFAALGVAGCLEYGTDHDDRTDPAGTYVIHEWGVNTPRLEGGSSVNGGPGVYYGASVDKPVLYVYADEPMQLDVGVRFATGAADETWPPLPPGEFIQWNDIQVGDGQCETTPVPIPEMPTEGSELPWLPTWVVESADCLAHEETISKLLFYAGDMPEYQPPLAGTLEWSVDVDEQGTDRLSLQVTNNGNKTIGPTLLAYRDATSGPLGGIHTAWLAWGRLEKLRPGKRQTVELDLVALASNGEGGVDTPGGWDDQEQQLRKLLESAGLYDEEIDVFCDTWRSSFFGVYGPLQYDEPLREEVDYAPGAIAIHLWPEAELDEALRLQLDPKPRELSRIMVQYQQLAPPERPGAVRGTVWIETGNPGEPDFEPAAGAEVIAQDADGEVASTIADKQGRYALDLPAGEYTIVAWETNQVLEVYVPEVAVETFAATALDLYLGELDVVMKPNIYLYPPQTTEVAVQLELCPGCMVLASEPAYGDGWQVQVEPDGLIDEQWGYLFYEASVPAGVDTSAGWSVPRAELATFFEEVLEAYGLNATERSDFVVYWVDALPAAPHYHVFALRDEAVDAKVGLDVQPAPETSLRLWLAIRPAEQALALPAPEIERFERSGFSMVEWGVIVF